MFLKNSTISPVLQNILFLLFIVGTGLAIYYLIYIGNRHVDEHRRIRLNWNNIAKIILFVALAVIVIALYRAYPVLRNTTFAFFIAIVIAFLLNPIVNRFERWGLKRTYGIFLSYIIIIAVLGLLIFSIFPVLFQQASVFITNLPVSINNVVNSLNEMMVRFNIDPEMLNSGRENINKFLSEITSSIPDITKNIFSIVQGGFSSAVSFILIPIMSFFLLKDKDKIIRKGFNLIPNHYKSDALYLYKEINFGMSEFIRSRLLMAVFIGVATWIMLELFGIPFAIIIGLLTLIGDVVPYVGPIVATVPALIFAFIKSPIIFLWVGASSMVLQWIEQNIVGPKLMSGSSGVHELVVLVSIIVGGGIFGVWGMIFAIPAVILINILITFARLKLKGVHPVSTKARDKAELIAERKLKEKQRRENRIRKIKK